MTFPPQPPPAPGHGGQPQPPPNKPWVWLIVGVSVLAIMALAITFGVTYLNKSTTTTATSATTRPIPPSTSSPAASGGNRQQLPKRPTPLANPIGCEYTATPNSPAAKQATKPADGNVPSTGKATVTFKTNAGTIGLDLDRALAPCTVNSFVSLARQGYYTGTSCHRLSVEGLQMLQCGDPTGKGTGGPGYAFDDEVFPELQYGRGILAMANAGPGTNGSQFFMVFGEAPLPPTYTVFGSISDEGLTMLDKVAAAGVDPASAAKSPDSTGAPVLPVQFTEVSVGS